MNITITTYQVAPDEIELEAQCHEDATIEAAELVGPNSYEYDDLVDSISERLFSERSASCLG